MDWERTARALVHPLALDVLLAYDQASEETSPSEIAAFLELPLGRISYHIRKLVDHGLLVLVRVEPRRGALEHYYRAA